MTVFLAELAPVLRRHITFCGPSNDTHRIWPLDLGLLLAHFGEYILQQQLYFLYHKTLQEPNLSASLHRYYYNRPDFRPKPLGSPKSWRTTPPILYLRCLLIDLCGIVIIQFLNLFTPLSIGLTTPS